MPPLSPQNALISTNMETDDELEEEYEYNNNNNNNIQAPKPKPIQLTNDDNFSSRSFIIKSYSSTNRSDKVRYIYNTSGSAIVWRNVFLFFVLHLIYLYSYYVCFTNKCWYTWIFSKISFLFSLYIFY